MVKYLLAFCVFAQILYSQATFEWIRYYNDTSVYIPTERKSRDYGRKIVQDHQNYLYVAGLSDISPLNSLTKARITLLKYDQDGNLLWKRSYPETYSYLLSEIALFSMSLDNSGNIFLSGRNGSNLILLKYSPQGNIVWKKDTSETGIGASSLHFCITDNSGNVYTALSKATNVHSDVYLRKFNSGGNLLWQSVYDGVNHQEDRPISMDIDGVGNIIVGGEEGLTSGSDKDLLVLKYNPTGTRLWVKTFDGGSPDNFKKLCTDNSNNIYITGYHSVGAPAYEIVTVKYNEAGTQSWVSRYTGRPTYVWNEPSDIAIDGLGNCYVTGFTSKNWLSTDYVTLKYNSSGAQQWAAIYNSSFDMIDIPSSIKINAQNDIFVCGESIQNEVAYLIIKYNSTGTQQWLQQIDSASTDEANFNSPSLHLSQNNLYLIGSKVEGENSDFLLAKYYQVIGITNISNNIPKEYWVAQNYPNPFNPVTNIKFDIVNSGWVKINIYDALGKKVQQLVAQQMNPGSYKVDWDASNYPSGVYFYKLEAGDFTQTKKMILLK